MDIKQVCGDIRRREILLYGEQEEIEAFLEKYIDELNIQYALTEYHDEVILQPYMKWNLKTVMMEQAEISENQLIVICAKGTFGTLRRRLIYMKKKEYKEYICSELVDALLYDKKLIICMGTQMLEQVCLLLHSSENICRQYSILYYPESELMMPYMNRMAEYSHVSRYCHIYIRSACEKERFLFKVADKNISNRECKIITVADFGFGGYYPQVINNRDAISNYLLRGHDRLPMDYETLALSRTDEEIVKLCNQNVPKEDIVERLLNPDYYQVEEAQHYFEKQLERFKALEVTTDIPLGDYIEKHKGEYLCRNLNEWSEPIISYVAEEIGKIINMPQLNISREQRITIIEENSGSEMIVYPSVQKALGLENAFKNKKYKVVTYHQSRYMSMEEYLYFMIEYLYRAIDIINFAGMDDIPEC